MNVNTIQSISEKIYNACFGHLDDKYFYSNKIQEIYDWLIEGDLSNNPVITDLINEWREYDSENPNIK